MQRLSAHAEEIAYNDPPGGISEELILNDNLQSLLRFIELSAFQRSTQNVSHVPFQSVAGRLWFSGF